MTQAVCFNCGELKFGSFTECENCHRTPENDDDMAFSMALSDHYFSLEQLNEIGNKIKNGENIKLNDADKQKLAAAREKILKLKDAKRKIKDQRRQKKNKVLGIKDSYSIDMQRKLAMVEHVLGDVDNDIQIAESITLQSTPSHIKEINKKLYGKNDKGRSKQTR